MIKSVTLISVAITSVVLVTLVGVVYAYQGLAAPDAASNPTGAPDPVSFPPMGASPTNIPDVSPQDAASIAAKFSSRTDLYSVEVADFNGAQTYKVSFSSGDVIFVGLNGQVLASVPPQNGEVVATASPVPPVVVSSNPPKRHAGHGNGGSSGDSGGGGEHQGGDD